MSGPRWTNATSSASLLAALGVFSAGLLLAEVNVLASRNYFRIDVSSGQRYSISHASRHILEELSTPVHLTVLLAPSDPLFSEFRQLLQSYSATTSRLTIQEIDPDRQPAAALAMEQKFQDGGMGSGVNGSDVAVVIEAGDQRWFVRKGQLTALDEEGATEWRMEAALTEGIAQVQSPRSSRLCFVSGHGERSLDDAAPEGLVELRSRLAKSNLKSERVPLDVPHPENALLGCDSICVIGPQRPWPSQHEEALLKSWNSGTHIALFLDPLVGAEGEIVSSGLDQVVEAIGVQAESSFVVEEDPTLRLPGGLGESFFATPRTHAITRDLSTEEMRLDTRVLLSAARAIFPLSGSGATVLLETSDRARSVTQMKELGQPISSKNTAIPLAIARKRTSSSKSQRALVIGSSNLTDNHSFRDPALLGNRRFTESAFAWLSERPALVSVPEQPPIRAGLSLSEDSLSSLLWYVLVYIPVGAASLGAFILTRRQRQEDASREEAEEAPP